jgi:hypothetical protein
MVRPANPSFPRAPALPLLLAVLALASCGDVMAADEGKGGDYVPPDNFCYVDADCPNGLVCLVNACVSPVDELPPEEEEELVFHRPAASAGHLFALSTGAGSVAIIDPATLDIEAVPLPDEPVAIAVIPGQEAAVILSRRGESLSYLALGPGGWTLAVQRTHRRYGALTLSPDGATAVLWTPDGEVPDGGAEGIVGIADVAALAAGAPVEVRERAAGRRHSAVVFRSEGGAAADAVVVGQDEIAVIDLINLDSQPIPDRIRLPATHADLAGREAVSSPDGARLLIRSFVDPNLLVLDVATRTLTPVALPAVATDIDLSADGTLAVAALRSLSQVLWFPVPEALSDPSLFQVVPVEGVIPGQVELSADASFAVVFSTTEDSETLGLLDLAAPAPAVEAMGWLQKWIRSVELAPDGRTAVVFHRPNPDSTVSDAYEREVDQDEGYSVLDLTRGFAQLKRTLGVPPREAVFTPDGKYAAVTLRDDEHRRFEVDAIDLGTLVTDTLALASAPEFAGAMPAGTARPDRIWVTQVHPAGRIGFVDLADRAIRTATGYELNSEIE